MNVKYINPFLAASINLFKTHLGLDLSTGKPFVKGDPQDLEEVSGIIGLAGETIGAVVLSFSRKTAIQIISRFSDCKYTALSNIVLDGVGAAAQRVCAPRIISALAYLIYRVVMLNCIQSVFGDSIKSLNCRGIKLSSSLIHN